MQCNPEPFSEVAIFECQQCGQCCKGYGGTYITESDIAAISAFIGVAPEGFVKAYCRISANRPVLAQGKDGYCIFWKTLCGVHPVKPRMCRAWPYINSVLKAPENWRIMASCCPGMRTDVSDETIVACVTDALTKRDESRKTETGQ